MLLLLLLMMEPPFSSSLCPPTPPPDSTLATLVTQVLCHCGRPVHGVDSLVLPQPLLGNMCGHLGVAAFETSFLKPQVPLPMQLGKFLLNGLFKQVLKSSKDWSRQMILDGRKERGPDKVTTRSTAIQRSGLGAV